VRESTDGPSPVVIDAIKLSAITALFILTVPLGLPTPLIDPHTTVIWPAAGLGLGAFIVFGWRILPAVFVGSFLVFVQKLDVLPAATLSAATLVEAVVGGWLLRWLARGTHAFDRPRDLCLSACPCRDSGSQPSPRTTAANALLRNSRQ
jgi:MASE1